MGIRLDLEKEREKIIARNWLNYHVLSFDEQEILRLYRSDVRAVNITKHNVDYEVVN